MPNITSSDLANILSGKVSKPAKSGRRSGSNWQSLESLVLASQGRVLEIQKIDPAHKWVGEGKALPKKQFVDFVGCTKPRGRMIVFDAKQWGDGTCRLDLVKGFQREVLRKYQRAGAIAGLLIESTKLGRIFWFEEYPWFGPIEWDSKFLVDIGSNKMAINFGKVPGVRL